MKELTIEQKAKAYDEAIKVARSKIKNDKDHVLYEEDITDIFPVFKESEDEKIRQFLIHEVAETSDKIMSYRNMNKKDVLAWLERQGEQKLPIEKLPSEMKSIGESLGFTTQKECDKYNQMVTDLIMSDDDNGEQKPAENKRMNLVEEEMTPFQKKVFCIIDTTIEEEQGLKQVCDELLTLASNEIKQKPTTEIKSAEESLGIDSDTYNKIVDECIYGEQKHTDKVEPKFKVDDWIIKNDDSHINIDYICCKIIKVENGNYTIESIYGYKGYNTFDTFEKDYHLWTIQDAKDGDVLACDSKHGQEIGIVKKYIGKYGGCDSCFETYCFVDWDDIFRVGEYMGSRNIHPAIKEQRDLLFKKMKEAGYEFDFEKKELKKIEQKPADKVEPKFKVGQTIKKEGFNSGFPIVKIENGFYYNDMGDNFPFTDQDNWKLVEQKPTEWSEEDSRILYNVKAYIGYAAGQSGVKDELFKEANEWLNSLPIGFIYSKNYNEDMVTLLVSELKQIANDNNVPEQYQMEINWLKSLRPQKQWKPSEEQMKALDDVISSRDIKYDVLSELYKDLKKLREE